MVCAETGCTARAKPAASEVTRKLRRSNFCSGSRLSNSALVSTFIIPPRCAGVDSSFVHDLSADKSVADLALEFESEKGRVLALAFQCVRQDGPALLGVEDADIRGG